MDTAIAKTAISDILTGKSPNGVDLDALGEYLQVYTALTEAHDAGGTEAARRVFNALCAATPGLTELVAGEVISAPEWKYQLRTLANAYEPREPIEYVLSDTFALPSLNIVYGPPGCLKSMLLADAAICVATGKPFLEPYPDTKASPKATLQVPVLWVDFDNGRRRSDERFEAIGRAHKAPIDAPLYYVSMPTPWLEANKSDSVDGLITLALELNVGMLVIDNLGTITGNVEENSAGMVQVMGNLRRVAEITKAAVVVIHHQRKSSGMANNARAGDALRGHSSIESALDLALKVERGEEEHVFEVTVIPTKTRGPSVGIFAARFTWEHREGSSDLATAKMWGIETDKMSDDDRVRKMLLDALQNEGMGKTEWIDKIRQIAPQGTKSHVRNIAEKLITEGLVTATELREGRTATIICELKSYEDDWQQ